MTAGCLTSEEIDRWQAGEVEAGRAAAIDAHLRECDECAKLVAAIDASDVRLLGRLRQAAGVGDAASGMRPPRAAGLRVVREISRGGQGVVFEAEQAGTKRRVAIKLLLDGAYATPAARRRFEREIELVAGLKHPHVVAVFHAGETDDGCPFCAMDYVDGVPLNRYVRERRLGLRDVLALFATVCDAVQYAHQRGVIHRDLKPSNILVEVDGTPRVLDFGLAKQLGEAGAREAGPTVSRQGQIVGTLPYMSPEQARGQAGEIDTRTDVYALGVILYELLTGRFPYPLEGSLAEVLRNIQEAAPTPPSRAWTPDAGVARPQRAGRRSIGGSWWRRAPAAPIDDEVQTLVLRALAKERERRYQSAADLAQDVRRYLGGEALEAKRDSGLYLLRKALRRHRVAVGVATGFMTLVTGAAIALGFMYRVQVAERARAEGLRALAEQRAAETKEAAEFQAKMLSTIDMEAMGRGLKRRFREQVRVGLDREYVGEHPSRRRRTPEEVDARMAQYDQLAAAALGPDVARGVLDEHVLSRAMRALEREFADQPLVRAEVLDAVATAYQAIGLYDAAESAFRAVLALREHALGRGHRDTARSLYHLATLLNTRGDPAAAVTLAREALELQHELLGQDHADVASTLNLLGIAQQALGDHAAAGAALREALAIHRRLVGDDGSAVASSLNNLGLWLQATGDLAAAEPMLREALAQTRKLRGDDHLAVTTGQNNLGLLLLERGDLAAAEPLLRAALARRREASGDEDPHVATSLNALAGVLRDRGDLAGAEELAREALALRRKLLGDEHPAVATSLSAVARLVLARGDVSAAEPLYREALELRLRTLGPAHADTAASLVNLGQLLQQKGDYAAAEPLLREGLALQRRILGEAHPDVATALNNLGVLLKSMGRYEEAEDAYRESLALRRRALGDAHPLVATSLHNLAALLRLRGDAAAAETCYREALELRRRLLGDAHPDVARTLNSLAVALKWQGKYDAAESLYREALAVQRRAHGEEHPDVAAVLNNLAQLLAARGDQEGAEPLLREALAIYRKRRGGSHPDVALCLNNLGQVLALRGDADQAGECYREALAMRRKLLGERHPDVVRSLCNLADLLRARGDFAAAEPLLHEADAALTANRRAPATLRQRVGRAFVALYEDRHAAEPEQGYDAEAARWRERLEEIRSASQPASRPGPTPGDEGAAGDGG